MAGNSVGVKIQDKYYFSKSGFGCGYEVMKVKWLKRKADGCFALRRSFFFRHWQSIKLSLSFLFTCIVCEK